VQKLGRSYGLPAESRIAKVQQNHPIKYQACLLLFFDTVCLENMFGVHSNTHKNSQKLAHTNLMQCKRLACRNMTSKMLGSVVEVPIFVAGKSAGSLLANLRNARGRPKLVDWPAWPRHFPG